jgi:membrane-bound lytic murein transglycosylase B
MIASSVRITLALIIALIGVFGEAHGDSPPSRFRGWGYLVERLRDNGVSESDLIKIYSDPRMPERTFVPFSVKPREPSSIYEGFKRPQHQQLGREFIDQHAAEFDQVETKLKVPREVVAAIIVIESGAGKNTGNHLLIYRLSRLAGISAPDNLRENYVEQKKLNHRVVFEDVRRRGRYLERTFLPEIPALIAISKRNQVDVLSMKGSSAGAFGLPQFLPSAFLRFGIDGNRDGIVSLHNETDAIWSAANYLASFGFRQNIPLQEKRSIIWRYNKSPSYIDSVLHLAERIRKGNL